ncbi:MAG: hypothetical protein ABIM42_07735 [candidate division WOR-3 bacterium]
MVLGFNKDYNHDIKEDFVKVMQGAIKLGVYRELINELINHELIDLYISFIDWHKSEILKWAKENGLDWIFKDS